MLELSWTRARVTPGPFRETLSKRTPRMSDLTVAEFDLDDLPVRIRSKIRAARYAHPDLGSPCWMWQACKTTAGYGNVGWRGKMVYAHRLVFELLARPILAGLELDHLCRVHRCVNPAHLEPVTHAENMRRGQGGRLCRSKTLCPQGHPYAGENLRVNPRGSRECRTCRRENSRASYASDPEKERARSRAYRGKRDADPVRYAERLRNGREYAASRYADPARYAEIICKQRERSARIRADPVRHAEHLRKKREQCARRRESGGSA